MGSIDTTKLDQALVLLEALLDSHAAVPLELVVCGGSSLIATGLLSRTTKDLDIVALRNNGILTDPSPLPAALLSAARQVADNLNLPPDWLNDGPADLFRMGLPEGFNQRLIPHPVGPMLTVHYISRLDQIHFKLYASVDRGGYHITDLLALHPAASELIAAGRWSCTHDVSETYARLLKEFLNSIGYHDAAANL